MTNTLTQPHSFVIDGVVDSGEIAPDATASVSFVAPSADTYLYEDPRYGGASSAINRVLGLHGVLAVLPVGSADRPFANGPQFVREYVWVFHGVDPQWGALARTNTPAEHFPTATPRYFLFNGRSGKQAVVADDTAPAGKLNEPALIRMVSAGPAAHAPHFHGNHVVVLTHNAEQLQIRMRKDVVALEPLDRKDVLLEFRLPPDVWPPENIAPGNHYHYPMHCHTELSQTARGGLYPSGMLTDWTLET